MKAQKKEKTYENIFNQWWYFRARVAKRSITLTGLVVILPLPNVLVCGCIWGKIATLSFLRYYPFIHQNSRLFILPSDHRLWLRYSTLNYCVVIRLEGPTSFGTFNRKIRCLTTLATVTCTWIWKAAIVTGPVISWRFILRNALCCQMLIFFNENFRRVNSTSNISCHFRYVMNSYPNGLFELTHFFVLKKLYRFHKLVISKVKANVNV